MRSTLLAIIAVLALATGAEAGAWLRSEGGGFASSSLSINRDREVSGTVYLEYGLRPDRTLGADISFGVDRTGTQEGSAILFLRVPLGRTDQTHKFAAHIGIGARVLNEEVLPAAETGLSWGRGFQVGQRYGWVNVDGSYNLTQHPASDRIKLDLTAGLGISNKSKLMMQMFNTFQDGDQFVKLAPSLLMSLGRNSGTTLQLGAEVPVSGGGTTSLKIAFWREW